MIGLATKGNTLLVKIGPNGHFAGIVICPRALAAVQKALSVIEGELYKDETLVVYATAMDVTWPVTGVGLRPGEENDYSAPPPEPPRESRNMTPGYKDH